MTVTSASGTVALSALSGLFWPAPMARRQLTEEEEEEEEEEVEDEEDEVEEKDEEDEIVATVPCRWYWNRSLS